MSLRNRRGLLVLLGSAVLSGAVLYLVGVGLAIRNHFKEDTVILGGKAIEYAIWLYRDKHGVFPSEIHQLIPEYLERTDMPSGSWISAIVYRVSADRQHWTLDIHAALRDGPRVYRRNDTGLDSADEARWIETKNGCYVLEED